jgi:phosphatidylglycerophosphatase A
MTANTNSSAPDASAGASSAVTPRKPRFALFLATACGLGYLPLAPGTWGSFAGLLLPMVPWCILVILGIVSKDTQIGTVSLLGGREFDPYLGSQIWIALLVGAVGVWSTTRAANYWSQKDPQRVVIDEVSGQHLALLLGCAVPVWWKPEPSWIDTQFGFVTLQSALNWKYLLLGLILFRVFDIWKPFPVRQAESLPGGWGIMADDWVAAIYAALGLWIARAAGL